MSMNETSPRLISLPLELPENIHCPCRFFLCEIAAVENFFSHDVASYLADSEIAVWSNIRDVNYRRAWLAGRFLVKGIYESLRQNASEPVLNAPRLFPSYEIISRNASRRGIRPYLTVDKKPTPTAITITHSESMIGVGIALSETIRLGMDVASLETVSQKIVKTFFQKEERQMVYSFPDEHWAERLWCVKEAAYKALNDGEPFMPSRFNIASRDDRRLEYSYYFENKIQRTILMSRRVGDAVYAIGTNGVEKKVKN
ncbi:MAG: 4'-phosphopantetheinyl transferase superfamily protein [Planctomycetaceae bacterium]|jgi:phosphopantetheinyl transferase (holo-ACP synthase)|nr:4'-phosphopantetheinyl transferase superfamily protein [Planctomycetaceae bacterium]